MNRVIKFRVRDRETKAFIGYEMLMPDITNYAWKWACSYGGVDWQSGIYDGAYHLREQFTGFLDKNGVEIYERDIIREPNGEIGPIEYHRGAFEGMVKNPSNFDFEWEELEVIGNIYESSDLLV